MVTISASVEVEKLLFSPITRFVIEPISQLFVAVTKYPSNQKEENVFFIYNFRGFSPSPIALGLWQGRTGSVWGRIAVHLLVVGQERQKTDQCPNIPFKGMLPVASVLPVGPFPKGCTISR
jgi:hypothetical protein